MTPRPLRRITISDFRCLKGNWDIPLDAPIVLIHGANGTGKTSILAAVELALTGKIQSMRRHDPRYMEHLPHCDSPSASAAIEIETADEHGNRRPISRFKINGHGIEGDPALSPEQAHFYAERAYLDQESLSRLLELYLHTESSQESALARFANELLGLSQLDALKSGLHDAMNIRRLRKLSSAYAEAERAVRRADEALTEATSNWEAARNERADTRERLLEELEALGFSAAASGSDINLNEIESSLAGDRQSSALAEMESLITDLVELRGRIRGLSSRPATLRLDEARATASATAAAAEEWHTTHGAAVTALLNDIAALGIETRQGAAESLEAEFGALDRRFAEHESASAQIAVTYQTASDLKQQLDTVNLDISKAETRVGSLATSLAALREDVSGDLCPVCDRDFSEISADGLQAHIDRKINNLASEGAELQAMAERRAELETRLRSAEQAASALNAVILTGSELEAATGRRVAVAGLRQRFAKLRDVIEEGSELTGAADESAAEFAQMEAEEKDHTEIMSELAAHATALGLPAATFGESPEAVWERLDGVARKRSQELKSRDRSLSDTHELLSRLRAVIGRSEELEEVVTQRTEIKQAWDRCLNEANRRRDIARSVHKAASDTRAAIIERVFTQSLNDVWRDVFTRLAPSEPFVPAFGIPTTQRAVLKLNLQTIYKSSGTGGTPAIMLSTGNLNTAALSLFIALHLAVEPRLPCLVLDDPVQSMDEVHVAQFAGMLRVLSKHHRRQTVIAVHERALFEYLALELSPAFPGDKLITIELQRDSNGNSWHDHRQIAWKDDTVLAI